MRPSAITLRPAKAEDALEIASIFSASRALLSFLPRLHTQDEERWFVEKVVLTTCAVTLAEIGGRSAGFLARENEEIHHLYCHPDFLRRGLGTRLIASAKEADVDALELWCFQANWPARRFYEAHGFRAVEFTDGQRNEEKTPDLRYRWQRESVR